jgi:hypothetical protein
LRLPANSDLTTVSHSSGVARPCDVIKLSAIVEWSSWSCSVQYALSAIVVLVIWRLAAAKLLESQALLALLGAVVGSLFVQPRKD